ncbi:MAG: 50S ribosomal protein L17 [Chloroflexota bacterium]|jgi:large subunit ribosomal protein L17
MRHRVHGRKLGRDSAHRRSLIKNQIADLYCNGQITTTLAKARTVRPVAERLITVAKRGLAADDKAQEVHARRTIAARLPRTRSFEDEQGYYVEVDVIRQLFDEVAPRYTDRPGGYTRILKLGKRPGDNADMAILMLVEES